jgi:hypothetical protein
VGAVRGFRQEDHCGPPRQGDEAEPEAEIKATLAMARWVANGGGIKVDRAKENIHDLEARIAAFRSRDPYRVLAQLDPKSGEIVCSINVRENIPVIWGAVAADAIHNLRSTLDILWRWATNPNPGRRDARRGGQFFPFLPSHVLEARYKGTKEPRRKKAFKLALEIKPYKGGNDLLCSLHAADLRDKHEVPTLVAVRIGRIGGRLPNQGGFIVVALNPEKAPILEQGTEIFRFPGRGYGSRDPVDMNLQVAFEVAFGKGGPLQGELVLAKLVKFTEEVESVIEAFSRAGLLS